MVGDESAGVFAGYQIEGLIRHGGMASVYRARHLVLQRPAALKVTIAERGSEHSCVVLRSMSCPNSSTFSEAR